MDIKIVSKQYIIILALKTITIAPRPLSSTEVYQSVCYPILRLFSCKKSWSSGIDKSAHQYINVVCYG